MLGCRAMPSPEPILPETHERRCPSCRSLRVTPVGHVLAIAAEVWAKHRCSACGTAFWFVRPERS